MYDCDYQILTAFKGFKPSRRQTKYVRKVDAHPIQNRFWTSETQHCSRTKRTMSTLILCHVPLQMWAIYHPSQVIGSITVPVADCVDVR